MNSSAPALLAEVQSQQAASSKWDVSDVQLCRKPGKAYKLQLIKVSNHLTEMNVRVLTPRPTVTAPENSQIVAIRTARRSVRAPLPTDVPKLQCWFVSGHYRVA